MRKWVLPLLVFVLLGLSCATTTKDLRKKIEAGDYIDAVYDYPWEQVYDAIAFVWIYSEDILVLRAYSKSIFDHKRENKVILCRTQSDWDNRQRYYLSMGIFFEAQRESQTKVIFVQSHAFGGEIGRARIERIINESLFYLENGEVAYRKYTHVESLRTKKLYRSKGWIF